MSLQLLPLGAEVQGALLDVPEHREAVPQLRPCHPAGDLANKHNSPLLLWAGMHRHVRWEWRDSASPSPPSEQDPLH